MNDLAIRLAKIVEDAFDGTIKNVAEHVYLNVASGVPANDATRTFEFAMPTLLDLRNRQLSVIKVMHDASELG